MPFIPPETLPALCTTGVFTQGDPSYEWVLHFLKNSKRKWAVKYNGGHEDYVPSYNEAQIFCWNGFWVEIKRSHHTDFASINMRSTATIYISIYTLNYKVLSQFVESAGWGYKETTRKTVTVHTAQQSGSVQRLWTSVKSKARHPLNSIVTKDGTVESLLADIHEFLDTEEWYHNIGIPHRHGYLLHGPPGSAKSWRIGPRDILAILVVYVLAVSTMSKKSILLIEDIDCAFVSRDSNDDASLDYSDPNFIYFSGFGTRPNMPMLLSMLLNTIDGVGSDDGRVFFATLATKAQASALFTWFFTHVTRRTDPGADSTNSEKPPSGPDIKDLAVRFAVQIPDHEFSTAELQGLLLLCKDEPNQAIMKAAEWVDQTRAEHSVLKRKGFKRDS
ncbi:hypothetical protein DXG01_005229 [Tephrocybe rancida]|nr:hypothetical protein DXG01_005229 [Tephrocybe rancida]